MSLSRSGSTASFTKEGSSQSLATASFYLNKEKSSQVSLSGKQEEGNSMASGDAMSLKEGTS